MKVKIFTFNPFMENTYVVYDETNEAIIIDAGALANAEKQQIREFLEENNLILKRVLNTHLHLDHQFGNKFLYDTFGIAPEAHEGDLFLLEGYPTQTRTYGIDAGSVQPLKRTIQDNEKITSGNTELIAIHVPGHSPGSLVFYNEKEKVIFSGDVLFLESIGRTDLAGGNHATLIKGISDRLLTLPDNTIVYPGHGDNTTIGYERIHNPFL